MFFNNKPVRKIINGKLYDTSKAEKVISFKHKSVWQYKETLYTLYKGKTEWFLENSGYIEMLTEDRAKELLVRYDIDKYIKYFGEPELA